MKLRIMLFSVLMLFIISGITTAQDDAEPASAIAKWSGLKCLAISLVLKLALIVKRMKWMWMLSCLPEDWRI